MAKAHVYVRAQVTSSDEGVLAIQRAGRALERAIIDAGGECSERVTVSLDTVEPVADPVPAKAARATR